MGHELSKKCHLKNTPFFARFGPYFPELFSNLPGFLFYARPKSKDSSGISSFLPNRSTDGALSCQSLRETDKKPDMKIFVARKALN